MADPRKLVMSGPLIDCWHRLIMANAGRVHGLISVILQTSDGYLTDQKRPVAWRYRNWLIQTLNDDLPFDRMTEYQLAGDLVDEPNDSSLIATGFLRNTLSNREGGADLEEYRVEQIVDRTQMVGTIWLGLTIGCARCHDHKYDPSVSASFMNSMRSLIRRTK